MNVKVCLMTTALLAATAVWAQPDTRLSAKKKQARRATVENRTQQIAPTALSVPLELNGNQRLDSIVIKDAKGEYQEKTIVEYGADGKVTTTEYRAINKWSDDLQQYIFKWIEDQRDEVAYDSQGRQTVEAEYWWDSEKQSWKGNGGKTERSYSNNGRSEIEVYSTWDDDSMQWEYLEKSDRTYDNDGNITEAIRSSWNKEKSEWEKTERDLYTYDEHGRDLKEEEYEWDDKAKAWTPINSMEWKYDNKGLCTHVYYNDGWANGAWQEEYLSEYEYDDHGESTVEKNFLKNETGEWELTEQYKYENHYDSQGRMSEYIASEWYADKPDEWVITFKRTFTYADDGEIIETTYDYEDGNWIPSYQLIEKKDEHGENLYQASLEWNAETNKWEDTYSQGKAVYTYDEKGREIEILGYGWSVEKQIWYLSSKRIYEYDVKDNVTLDVWYSYNQETEELELYEKSTYTYAYDAYGNVFIKTSTIENKWNDQPAEYIETFYYSEAPTTGNTMVSASTIHAYVNGRTIYADGLPEGTVALYDLSGRLLSSCPAENGRAVLTAPTDGVYIVRSSEHTCKVIVRGN